MKKYLRIAMIAIASLLTMGLAAIPVMSTYATADDGSSCLLAREHQVETTFFGTVDDSGDGCSVFKILNLGLGIMGGIVAVGGLVGIAIVGVQYMSSKQDEQMAAKAKRRLLEIIVGIAIYAVLHTGMIFLLSSDAFNAANKCG